MTGHTGGGTPGESEEELKRVGRQRRGERGAQKRVGKQHRKERRTQKKVGGSPERAKSAKEGRLQYREGTERE